MKLSEPLVIKLSTKYEPSAMVKIKFGGKVSGRLTLPLDALRHEFFSNMRKFG